MRKPDPCEVGDHYSCERARCRCTCHPRFTPRRKSVESEPLTTMRGATWRAPKGAA